MTATVTVIVMAAADAQPEPASAALAPPGPAGTEGATRRADQPGARRAAPHSQVSPQAAGRGFDPGYTRPIH